MAAKRSVINIQQVFAATWGLKPGGLAITWNGDQFVRQAFIDARDVQKIGGIRSFREPLKLALDDVVIPAIKKNFAVEGRPPWIALSPATLRNRAKIKPKRVQGRTARGRFEKVGIDEGKILDRTGTLKKFATQKNMWDIRQDQLIFRSTFFSNSVRYGPYHQLGTRKMPQRVFISIRFDDEDKIKDIFDLWFTKRIYKYWKLQEFRE